MSKKLIVANWKLNPETLEDARRIASKVEQGLLSLNRAEVETVICPPFVFLPAVSAVIHFAKLGAQNVSRESEGAHTGETSARQLKQFDVEYIIVGHSERRNLGEDDKLINAKIMAAKKAGLLPILCVGYGTKRTDSAGKIKKVIQTQVQKGLMGVKGEIAIAYEPVWAIGAKRAATPAHAEEIAEFIKSLAPKARVLYGGSVDGKNASGFAAQKNISGALVGAASLVSQEFLQIIKSFS